MPTRSILALLDYIIRGVEHQIHVKPEEQTTERKEETKQSAKEDLEGSTLKHFSDHITLEPRSLDTYIDDLYNAMQDLDLKLNDARKLVSLAYDIDLARLGRAKDPQIAPILKKVLDRIVVPRGNLRKERLNELLKKLVKLRKSGVINIEDEKAITSHTHKLERVLFSLWNNDINTILRNLAFNSNNVREYLEKARILLTIAKDLKILDQREVRGLLTTIDDIIDALKYSRPSYPGGLAQTELARDANKAIELLLPMYESIARKYSYRVSLPPVRRVNPVDTHERERWKPWRDDVSTLDIVESYIKGCGQFLWGITTVKKGTFYIKAYREDVSKGIKVAVSIDVSGSMGSLTGEFRHVIEYELVIALAIYNYAYRIKAPFILHVWSDRDELIEFTSFNRERDLKTIVKALQRISLGGTLANLVVDKISKHPDWLWIVISDFEWSNIDLWKFRRLLERRDELTYAILIEHSTNYRVQRFGGTERFCKLYPDSEVCKLLRGRYKKAIVRMFNIEKELGDIITEILRVFRQSLSHRV